uniref:Uncharacterized protein n=1 Tax=Quercus lobata TaxID=97700 RepID=A0A7N2MZ23_QUELO
MEEEGIGLVLAKATELRFKISNCIHKATTNSTNGLPEQEVTDKDEEEEEEQEQEEMERLLNISDALESLENQLSSLQGQGVKCGNSAQQRQGYIAIGIVVLAGQLHACMFVFIYIHIKVIRLYSLYNRSLGCSTTTPFGRVGTFPSLSAWRSRGRAWVHAAGAAFFLC